MKPWAVIAASLLIRSVMTVSAESQPIAPPFGLSWVEKTSQIAQVIEDSHLHLSQKESVEGREAWTVEGFDQPALSAAVFYFVGDDLDEVELQYRDPKWSLAEFGNFMAQVKQSLDLKYGHPEVLAHSREPEKNITQTVVGYRWQQPGQCVDLVFFSAEREPLNFRLLSLHYKVQHQESAVRVASRND